MRTSADRDESYPRIRRVTAMRIYICARARAGPSIYACGSGREVPSFGLFFVSCITRAHVHTHAHAHAHIREREREREKMCTRVCVYIALLDCVPGGWIRRSPEIGCCEKKRRKSRSPNFFPQVTTCLYRSRPRNRCICIIVDGTPWRLSLYDTFAIIDPLDNNLIDWLGGKKKKPKNYWNFDRLKISIVTFIVVE